MNKCMDKGHKFQKFDEQSLFCERCGERRVIAPAVTWWQGVMPPSTWPWRPYQWPTVIWSDTITTGTISTGSTFTDYPDGSSVTYTGSVSTNAIAGPQTQTPRGVRQT